MKTLIAILLVTSLLQSTFIPVDLVLMILICRAFIKEERGNLYLAFVFGLLVSFLNGQFLGFQSIIYLIIIFLTHFISKSRFTKNSLFLIIPSSFALLFFNSLVISLLMKISLQPFPKVFLETIAIIPVFYLLRIWEERFIPRKDIKLRV